ncbi:MAG: hypothetical protein JO295_01535 [Verrucomicrobia bacterium]|nr:hypothetical protein [Verrucomicrobiota bacterium]
MRLSALSLFCFALGVLLAGCETESSGIQRARLLQRSAITREPPGNYFIGRRYYNSYYKFWGYIRSPGQPWATSQLVMLNEKQKLAPDREINQIGVDDNCEYRLYGHFTGDKVYEPASNHQYPEFLLERYELIDRNPPSIFPPGARLQSTEIAKPEN